MIKTLGISLFFLLLTNAYAIRNGYTTNLPDNVVTLKIHDSYACTGLRISQNYIITAAHCMTSPVPSGLDRRKKNRVVISYADNNDVYSTTTKTSKAIIKSYKNSKEIAVLYIPSKNKNYKAPKISTRSADIYLNNNIFYGFGFTEKGGFMKLRKGYLNSSGTDRFNGHTMLVMRPGNQNHQPCPGDSGGPLFTPDRKALGIVSFVNSSNQSLSGLSPKSQCQKANRSYFIYLAEHLDFLAPYL